MLRRILVPLDESKLSETAIPCALDFARRCSAETVLVEVVPHFVGQGPGVLPMSGREMECEQLTHSKLYLEKQAGLWETLPVSIHTPVGRTCEQICALAFEKGCDLILMTSHGRDHFPRWLLGSAAEGVLRQAHCPVLLLRPPAVKTSEFRKILVPSDGSEASLAFLPDLQTFLAPGGTITLLLSRGTASVRPLTGMEAHFGLVEQRLRQMEWKGQPYPVVVLTGDPASEILDWSENNKCDLIAMSTHGRSGFRRFWLGSVTEKVARHAPCPVLVFPHVRPVEDEV